MHIPNRLLAAEWLSARCFEFTQSGFVEFTSE